MADPEKRHRVFLAAPNIATASSETKDGSRYFRLTAGEFLHSPVQGISMRAWGFNGGVPGPLLVTREGEPVEVLVENRLREAVAVYWRGLSVSNELSGCPITGTGPSIQPGESFTYAFTPQKSGTYLYHAHLHHPRQLNMGLAGMMLVLPSEDEGVDRDYALLFQGWMLQKSKAIPGLTQNQMDWLSQRIVRPLYEIAQDRHDYNYFTINGKAFPDTLPLRVRQGDNVRIRLGNASHSAITIHIHGHVFRVVACDGCDLPAPWQKHTLTVNPGETWDVELNADNPGTWALQAQQPKCLMNDGRYPGGILTTIRYAPAL